MARRAARPTPRRAATGFFTTIRRGGRRPSSPCPTASNTRASWPWPPRCCARPPASPPHPTLKTFLTARADAFLSNDYYASDVAWMELDAAIEPTIGPYEVYEDEWFNAKAAFEAFITVRDDAESKKLQAFSAHLQELENNLPIDAKYRNPKLGALAPIRVVNVVFAAGDGNRGVQTAAYNLPNDERVVREKGTKRVMLKNVQDAKFKMVLLPIAKVALPAAQQKDVSFDAFFTHILMHELMHGLGPHNITVGGRADDGPAGAEGHLQRDRGSQGRRLRPVGAQAARRHRARRRRDRADDVHDVPGVVVPLDPLRRQRSARPRHRRAAQLVPGRRRLQGAARRHLHGRQREDRRRRDRADPRDHDAAGRRQLRQGEDDDRHARRSSGRRCRRCSTG